MVRISIVHLVLFIAVLGVSALFAGMLADEAARYAGVVEREGDRDAAELGAEIAIVNDPAAGTTYEDGTTTLYVKNVGGETLDPDRLSVLVDGEYVTPSSLRVVDGDHWRVGRVLEVSVDGELETGDHRAAVRIDGAEEVLEFEHRIAFWLDPSGRTGVDDENCDEEACTVDLNETDTLELTMGTDEPQEGETVSYTVNDTTVATVDPDEGATDATGENATTLDLEDEGEVAVTLDAGWDEDTIVVRVVNSGNEWATFGYDGQNTGFNPSTRGLSTDGDEVTSAELFATGDDVWSSTAVVDGILYVGSDDGNLYAVDAETGDEAWNRSTGDYVDSSPTVAEGVVYVGSWNGSVHAFDADDGSEEWVAETDDGVFLSSPTLEDGTIYLGDQDGTVYAFDAETGAEEWRTTEPADGINSTVAVADETVVAASTDGSVYAFDADTGDESWNVSLGGASWSSPAVENGTVYVGDRDDAVRALELATGDEVWNASVDGPVEGSPAVANGTIVVGTYGGSAYGLQASNGTVDWTWSGESVDPQEFDSAPIVVDDSVYLADLASDDGTRGGNVYSIDVEDGSEQWYENVTTEDIYASPVVVDGRLYVGTNDDSVSVVHSPDQPEATFDYEPIDPSLGDDVTYDASDSTADGEIVSYDWDFRGDDAYDEFGETITRQACPDVTLSVEDDNGFTDTHTEELPVDAGWPTLGFGVDRRGVNDCSPSLPSDGASISQTVLYTTNGTIQSSPVLVDGTLFVGDDDGYVYAIDAETGSLEWSVETGGDVDATPTVVDGTVYVGSWDETLYALDADDGTEEWTFDVNGSIFFSTAAVEDGTVYVGTTNETVYAIDAATGDERWNATAPQDEIRSSPAVANGTVFVGSHDTNVYAFDADDGSERWSSGTGDEVWSHPTVADGVVYVGSDDGNVYALDADDGSELWSENTGALVRSSPAVWNGTVIVGTYEWQVYAFDADSGNQEWLWDDPYGNANQFYASPAVVNGTVYVADLYDSDTDYGGNVYSIDADDGSAEWFVEVGTDTSVNSAPAVVDGRLYVGTLDNDLVVIEES